MEIRSEEMQYRAGDERISAHLAMPAVGGKQPGIVLIHEIFGLDEQSKAAVKSVNQLLFVNRPIDLFVDYLSAGVEHLHSLEQVSGKIGSVGFCFGGGMSINLACTGKTDASVVFYGENPSPIDKLKGVKGAVMGLYGGEDTRINSRLHELVGALVEYKRPLSLKVFPGPFHGFFNDTRAQTYHKAAAEVAWQMVLSFFKENLATT